MSYAALILPLLLCAMGARALVRAFRERSAAQAKRAIGWGMGAFGLAFVMYGALMVRGFGAVAYADVSSKATLLAKSISEAMNCVAPGLVGGLVLMFVGGIAYGLYRSSKPAQR